MPRPSPFWFKRQAAAAGVPQRNITPVHVVGPGSAVTADIIALFELNNTKVNTDPNTLGLYGTWTGTPEAYSTHTGIMYDNGFQNYLTSGGLQISDWGTGTLDTYFNTAGMTLSWVAKPIPTTNVRLMQYWQADLEYIEVYFVDAATLRISVSLGTGTIQSDDAAVSALGIDDGNFHHFVVTFHPGGDRIARLYINGILVLETLAVASAAVFGAEVANIHRGIGFGCSYTSPDTNYSGSIDHATILLGIFAPTFTGLDNRMLYNGFFMRYYGGQMYYTP